MMKRIFVCMVAFVLTIIGMTSAFAASTQDSAIPQGSNAQSGAAY